MTLLSLSLSHAHVHSANLDLTASLLLLNLYNTHTHTHTMPTCTAKHALLRAGWGRIIAGRGKIASHQEMDAANASEGLSPGPCHWLVN